MILKKLIEILKTFDKEELRKFGKFIRSDYFNTNERITLLFKTLKKFYPLFDDLKLTSDYLFKEIYGSRKFDDKTFRYLVAELMEVTEKFLSLSAISENPLQINKAVIESLITRTLFSQAGSLLKASEGKLDRNFIISDEYLENKIDYSHLWHQMIFSSNKPMPHVDKSVEQGEHTTIHSIIHISHLYQTLRSLKSNFNIEAEENLLFGFVKNFNFKGMMDYIEKLEVTSKIQGKRNNIVNAFKIYLCSMITYTEEKDEVYFEKMRKLVDDYGKFFEKEELQNLYVMLANCCNIKMRTIDRDKYMRLYLEVIKSALYKGLMTAYEGQYMDTEGFYRIFRIAIDLKEYAWAEIFVSKFVNLLSPEFMDDLHNYSTAELFFWTGNFDESLKLLAKVRYKFARLKLSVRSLILMSYYELDYIEEAFSLIDSFTHFLNENNKMTEKNRELYHKLTNLIKDLLKYKTNSGEKKKISDIRNEILSTPDLHHKNWLIEKADELENKIKK